MLPSQEKIHTLIQSGDVFRYAIAGFTAIECALDDLILESLTTTHRLELKRLSAELKVDLSIGLGLLRVESKGLICKLSKVRNHYAHQLEYSADYCSPDELKSCFSSYHRAAAGEYFEKIDSFTEAMRVSFISAYYDVVNAIERQKYIKEQREEALVQTEAALLLTGYDERLHDYLKTIDESLDRSEVIREWVHNDFEEKKAAIRNVRRLGKASSNKGRPPGSAGEAVKV